MNLADLVVEPVPWEMEPRFNELMDRHHYLGAGPKIGETIWYAGHFGDGDWAALAAFSAASLKCTARDEWIGWGMRIQYGRLHLIANNAGMLLLGRRPNLGSRFLSLCERRIVADWRSKYHHDILLLETFVDPSRFTGAVYRAANWLEAGASRGYRRRGDGYAGGSSPKLVLLRPLDPRARSKLTAPRLAPEHIHGVPKMKLSAAELASIYDFFTKIDDPRSPLGRRYRLATLLALCAAATLCGAHGWKAIYEWIQDLSPKVLAHFKCRRVNGEYERPSIYCIRNIMTKVDPEQLSKATAAYCRSIGWDRDSEAIAVDGKTMRGSAGDDGRRTHVLAACTHGRATPLAQKKLC